MLRCTLSHVMLLYYSKDDSSAGVRRYRGTVPDGGEDLASRSFQVHANDPGGKVYDTTTVQSEAAGQTWADTHAFLD